MGENGNGSFKIAFWVLAVVTTIFMVGIVNAVIANDRINTSEHKDLRVCLYDKLTSIESRLTRIETKVDRR